MEAHNTQITDEASDTSAYSKNGSEDAELFIDFLSGEGDALINKYNPILVLSFRKKGFSYAEAADLAQDTWKNALRNREQLKDHHKFASWLRTISDRAANSYVNRVIVRNKRVSLFGGLTEEQSHYMDTAVMDREGNEPESRVLLKETQAKVRAAVEKLDDLRRVVVERFYDEHQSLIEISDALHPPSQETSCVSWRMNACF